MTQTARLRMSLLLLRLGVFIVMLMWTLDKFVNPEHAAKVWGHFYLIPGLGEKTIWLIGAAQLIVVTMFVLGIKKRLSYGVVLFLHAVSTFSSYSQYLAPWDNLLFFAAWPMLAACLALYLLRDEDRWANIAARRRNIFAEPT